MLANKDAQNILVYFASMDTSEGPFDVDDLKRVCDGNVTRFTNGLRYLVDNGYIEYDCTDSLEIKLLVSQEELVRLIAEQARDLTDSEKVDMFLERL